MLLISGGRRTSAPHVDIFPQSPRLADVTMPAVRQNAQESLPPERLGSLKWQATPRARDTFPIIADWGDIAVVGFDILNS